MKTTTKVWNWDGKTTDITIRLLDDSNRTEVTIARGNHFGQLSGATINWPGCGTQDATVAATFIGQMAVAHRIAQRLDQLAPDAFAATTEADVERVVEKALVGEVTW